VSKTIISVVGARPNFMKIAPILRQLQALPDIRSFLVHTGQHYDDQLSRQFFVDLALPEPDVNLEVGSGGHGVQTGEMMKRLEAVFEAEKPALVLVVGDVNSTVAAALVASKLHIPLAHIEAGLRSFDRRMPEEINRVVTDVLSDLLFVTEPVGMTHLAQEGISGSRVHLVGDVMIDSVMAALPGAREAVSRELSWLPKGPFGLVTLHRPSNVDEPEQLQGILEALKAVSPRLPLLFPVHPRTRARIAQFGLQPLLDQIPQLTLLPPLGYLVFLGLLDKARLVLTDSGGVQSEATFLGLPCLTLRDTTERPETVEVGANHLLGVDPRAIEPAVAAVLNGTYPPPRVPALMDGRAAERIAHVIAQFLGESSGDGRK